MANIGASRLANTDVETGLKALCARCIRDDADGTRLRVGTVGRSLWACQHLDTIHVINVRVQILTYSSYRLIIEINGHTGVRAKLALTTT